MPDNARPAIMYEMLWAPVWSPPPRQKVMAPMRIVILRPNLSPLNPATAAPQNAPPVKTWQRS